MTRLAPNFTLAELTNSETAIRRGWKNAPDKDALANLYKLAATLQQVKELLGGKPIIISSGFRNVRVNRLVGGVADSDHVLGYAADFKVVGASILDVCLAIGNSPIEYDQLINEFGRWVHLSVNPRMRKQNLSAMRAGRKTVYLRGFKGD